MVEETKVLNRRNAVEIVIYSQLEGIMENNSIVSFIVPVNGKIACRRNRNE